VVHSRRLGVTSETAPFAHRDTESIRALRSRLVLSAW